MNYRTTTVDYDTRTGNERCGIAQQEGNCKCHLFGAAIAPEKIMVFDILLVVSLVYSSGGLSHGGPYQARTDCVDTDAAAAEINGT